MANSRKSKSSDLLERVGSALQPHHPSGCIPAGSSILLGLSGGIDSVVLLHLLHQLSPRHGWRLSALHVHHGISPHADAWARFCLELCMQHGIPLSIEQVDIAPLRGQGVEAAARELRHAILARQEVDFVALAHHRDDQAETLLLQLLRGAGVRGASAMATVQPRKSAPTLLRPLLDIRRSELLEYAEQHGLHWVEDESNADTEYPRNFLRHCVLPLLEQRFPAYRDTLARSARHFAEASALLDALAEQDGKSAFDGETLTVAALEELDGVRAKNLLRWFLLQRRALMPDSSRLEEALRQLTMSRADAQTCIEWGDWLLRRYRGRVYVCRKLPEPDPNMIIPWRSEEEITLPELGGKLHFTRGTGEGLSLDKLRTAAVTIRLRHGEEALRPDATRPTRSLTYLFQEQGIPPWLRSHWPLVYCGETLVAVPGIGLHGDFRCMPDEAGVQLEWKC